MWTTLAMAGVITLIVLVILRAISHAVKEQESPVKQDIETLYAVFYAGVAASLLNKAERRASALKEKR